MLKPSTTTLLAASLLALVLGPAGQADGASGVQKTLDHARSLISKDVGNERWAITFNPDDQTATGNVFRSDGGEPAFVWCNATSNDGSTLTLACYGADKCPVAPCDSSQWAFISNVDLPAQFFLPPGTPPLSSCPMKVVANGPNPGSDDSLWDCHLVGTDHLFQFQIFENGIGDSTDIGPFAFGATACGTGTVDGGNGESAAITNFRGSRETGVMRFHQRGFGLDHDIVCAFVPF